MYKYLLNIGDWSDDGHWKNERIILESSHTKEQIVQAYKDSCKLTGVQFNYNDDYTGLGWTWQEKNARCIATEYEDGWMSKENIQILKKHGIDVLEGFDPEYVDEDSFYFDGVDNFVEILIKFIKLSLPTWEVKIVNDDIEWINGYGDFNHQFGYWLFG